MGQWKTPDDLRYTENDEWLRIEGNIGVVGITDYAQQQLNDIVYVELPETGSALARGDSFGVVESVKAAADVYLPVGGTVTEVNTLLEEQPELINSDPFGEGWIVKIRLQDAAEAHELMDAKAYDRYCEKR